MKSARQKKVDVPLADALPSFPDEPGDFCEEAPVTASDFFLQTCSTVGYMGPIRTMVETLISGPPELLRRT